MYELNRDIFEVEPPFLIVFGQGQWRVAKRIFPHDEGIGFVEPFALDDDTDHPSGVVPGTPWHVGDNVWEMDYNTRIMTLDHPHHRRHPAFQLWLHWLRLHPQKTPTLTH